MTTKERRNSAIINGSRRKRIALGSGTSVQKVNLLRQRQQMSKKFKTISSGGGRMQRRQMSGGQGFGG